MTSWIPDFRAALRSLRRAPGYTASAVSTIALGIASVTLVYALVSAILLQPLPLPDPGRVVAVYRAGTQEGGLSLPDVIYLRERLSQFAAIATVAPDSSFDRTDGERREPAALQLQREVGPAPVQRRAMEVGPGAGEPLAGPRRRRVEIAGGRRCQTIVEAEVVDDTLEEVGVGNRPSQAAQEEGPAGLRWSELATAHPREPFRGRPGDLVEARDLRRMGDERQPALDALGFGDRLPVDLEPGGETGRQTPGGLGEERKADRRAGDAAVGQLTPVAPQIGSAVEAGEQALDEGEHDGVVGIGTQEDQQVVERRDGARRGQPGPFEPGEERPLAFRPARPELRTDPAELGEACGRRLRGPLPSAAHERLPSPAAGRLRAPRSILPRWVRGSSSTTCTVRGALYGSSCCATYSRNSRSRSGAGSFGITQA